MIPPNALSIEMHDLYTCVTGDRCFAKRLDYDTVESGRDTLDSDSSVSTMQIDSQTKRSGPSAGNATHPLLD